MAFERASADALSGSQDTSDAPDEAARIDAIDRLLPQTQCTQCGFDGCRPYARAIVRDQAPINRCPPGGAAGIAVLAQHTGRAVMALDPDCGVERPRQIARIIESLCIGCTLCIAACPVDAIAGTAKRLHAVIIEDCTGCELCVAPCPVDCIEMVEPPAALAGWGPGEAHAARQRLMWRTARLARVEQATRERLANQAQAHLEEIEHELDQAASQADPPKVDELARKRAVIEAAMARARARLAGAP